MARRKNKDSQTVETTEDKVTDTTDTADTADTAEPTETDGAVDTDAVVSPLPDAGVYISYMNIPHPTKSDKNYSANVSFEVTKEDLQDPWTVMQIQGGVFKPYVDPSVAKKEAEGK